MGRPPLNMTATLIRFPGDVLKRIDALVGDKRRAQFIREAVVAEVERTEHAASASKKPLSGHKKRRI